MVLHTDQDKPVPHGDAPPSGNPGNMEGGIPASVEYHDHRQGAFGILRNIGKIADRMADRSRIIPAVVRGRGDLRDTGVFGHAQRFQVLLPGQDAAPALHPAPELRVVRTVIRLVPDQQVIARRAQGFVDSLAVADGNHRNIRAFRMRNHGQALERDRHRRNLPGAPEVFALQGFQAAAGNVVRRVSDTVKHGAEQGAADAGTDKLLGPEFILNDRSVLIVLADFALRRNLPEERFRRVLPAAFAPRHHKHHGRGIDPGDIRQAPPFGEFHRVRDGALRPAENQQVRRLEAVVDDFRRRISHRHIHQRAEMLKIMGPVFSAVRHK